MSRLRIVPLDDVVIFPGMTVTLQLEDVGSDTRVLLVPRQGQGFARVGVVAEVSHRVRLSDHTRRRFAARAAPRRSRRGGGRQGRACSASRSTNGPTRCPPAHLTRELEREYRAVVEEILELRGDDGRISAFLRSITNPGALADTSGYSPDLNVAQKIELLETLDVVERLKLALRLQQERLTELVVRKRIREDVEGGAQKQQREYFLRKQMDSIRKELGEDDASASVDYREKIASAGMPDAVRQQAERELSRLERVGDANAESATIRTYLDWLLAVPWSKRSDERLDPVYAREVLDADHEGLDEVKKRITEYLAVRKLRAERGMVDTRRSGVDAHADRTAGNRQDVDWRVDRQGDRTPVRAHVARRAPRRGGDPRPSPHLHRRAARTAGAGAARCRHHESGDHARRGRQARRRLARRSVGGAARSARPGAESLVPRSLPRRRARSVARAVHRDRQRGRHHSRSAAGSDGGHPLRRLHHRREGGHRARASVAAPDRAERTAS